MIYNEEFKRFVVDREVPLTKLLVKLGYKGYRVGSTCFCCFHINTETKSAKIYEDELGETLYCFSEQKLYRSSHAFEQLANVNLDKVFYKIWNSLSTESKLYYENNVDAVKIETISPQWTEALKKMDKFRFNKLTYEEVCNIILDTVKENSNG